MRSLSTHDSINVAQMAGIITNRRAYHFDGIDVLPLNKIELPEFFENAGLK